MQRYQILFIALISVQTVQVQFISMVQAAENTLPPRAQWARGMGQSGLRRIYATGGELGELVNRQVSYQIAQRITGLSPRLGLPDASHSKAEGYVAQIDSLIPFKPGPGLPVSIRALGRTATRIEKDKVHSRNDRLDLGMLVAPSVDSFYSLGLAMEYTHADLKFVDGETSGFAIGPRLDGGFRVNDVLALVFRLEDLQFKGENRIMVKTPGGVLNITRDIENHRSYFQIESILRLTRSQLSWLPTGMQLGGMSGIHYLNTWHEQMQNSLGQAVVEPFGDHERLGIVRVGTYLSSTLGDSGSWNTYAELLYDYEFDTNMNRVINDPQSTLLRLSVAHVPGPGKRVSLEYQGSWNAGRTRKRNNWVLSVVMDF